MDFTVTGATFLQCESQNYSGSSLALPLTQQISLKFTERFASAFRRRGGCIETFDVELADGELDFTGGRS